MMSAEKDIAPQRALMQEEAHGLTRNIRVRASPSHTRDKSLLQDISLFIEGEYFSR